MGWGWGERDIWAGQNPKLDSLHGLLSLLEMISFCMEFLYQEKHLKQCFSLTMLVAADMLVFFQRLCAENCVSLLRTSNKTSMNAATGHHQVFLMKFLKTVYTMMLNAISFQHKRLGKNILVKSEIGKNTMENLCLFFFNQYSSLPWLINNGTSHLP